MNQIVGRQQWTRFDVSSMTSGLLLLALVFGIGSAVVWQSIDSGAGHAVLALYVIPVFCSSVWHTVSMLSNSFITEVDCLHVQISFTVIDDVTCHRSLGC